MQRLEDKVAFITGGAGGQGHAIASRFAAEGADIVFCDIGDQETLRETTAAVEAAGRRCIGRIADVRDQQSLDDVVAEGIASLGQIDIVVANAGITGPLVRFWAVDESEWNRTFDINMAGVWRTVKAVAPHMIERRSGSVLVTSSMNGIEGGVNVAAYASTKHGVVGFMKCAGLELAPFGVRVNAVLPGPIDTPMLDNPTTRSHITGREGATRDDYLHAMRPFFALRGRTALPVKAITDAMTWLASDEAEHITGIELYVDAGHSLLPGLNPEPVGFDP
jgi:NAD(P)-dependent dehydrogenase (short-subunit alcohol dehydrogenase family)